ncbi:hypothetical protein NADFUDRAFT_7499, partial [Nadsonia fulvescens var. elongata DSM 6958]
MGLASKLAAAQSAVNALGGQGQYGQGQGQYGQGQGQYGQGQYGQGQYGQGQYSQGQGQFGQGSGQYSGNYLSLLQKAVQENRLESFYSPVRLQQIASNISGQLDQIVQNWRIPMEIAVDLVRLALYDIVLFVDDSGSMAFEENGERIDDLKLIVGRIAYAASLFDNDGIQVVFLNNQQGGNHITNDHQANELIANTKFHGLTPLGTNLMSKVIQPRITGPVQSGCLNKPVLVITITDGQPQGESDGTIFRTIKQAKDIVSSSRYGPGALAFQFAQVGNDMKAREFLAQLDKDNNVGHLVDCTSTFEIEQDEMAKLGVDLTPTTWLVKLLLGSIDRSYDTQDE